MLLSLRQIVQEEIQQSKQKELEEKLLSPKAACQLFQPAISRQTLDSLAKSGTLTKYQLGGKILFKYSELMQSLKTFKRYQKKDDHNFS